MVTWQQLRECLEASQLFLPAGIKCPVCGTDSAIYSTIDGPWWACRGCDDAGDSVDLLARCWQIPVLAARERLIRKFDIRPLVALRYRRQQDRRQRYQAAWRLASQQELPPHLLATLDDYGIPSRYDTAVAGRFVGALSLVQLCRQLTRPGGRLTAHKRKFVGDGWVELLLIPYFDAPARLSGLLCVGQREEEWPQVFLPLTASHGLGFLDYVWNSLPHRQCGMDLYSTRDPLLALSVHLQQTDTGLPAWPLVLLPPTSGATTELLSQLPTTRNILCGETLSVPLLVAGIELDASLALRQPGDAYTGDSLPRLFRSWAARARDWRQHLHDGLHKLSTADQLQYLEALPLSPIGLARLATYGSQTRKPENVVGRVIMHGRQTLTVTQEGWQHKDGRIVSDAVPLLQHVVLNTATRRLIYSGQIFYRRKRIPFRITSRVAESGSTHWLQTALLSRQLGPATILPEWRKRLWALTLAISRPAITVTKHRVGWDAGSGLFVLPGYVLGRRGLLQTLPATVDKLPGYTLPVPGALNFTWLAKTAQLPRRQADLFWSTTLAVLFVAVAGFCGEQAPSLALVGAGAQTLGLQTAAAYGCLPSAAGAWLSLCATQRVQTLATLRGQLLPAEAILASYLAVTADWLVLRDDTPRNPLSDAIVVNAGQVVANYLYSLADNDFQLTVPPITGQTFEVRVWQDFAEWLLQHGGPSLTNPGHSLDNRRAGYLWVYGRSAMGRRRSLETLFRELYRAGGDFVQPAGAETVWLGINRTNNALGLQDVPPLPTETVERLLGEVYQGERRLGRYGVGWFVCRKWWDRVSGP